MTDKMNDGELLKAFFDDCQMDIVDDGFSDRVMAALPSERTPATLRLGRIWTVVCVAIGVVGTVMFQGWGQVQWLFYSMKMDFLLSGSRALTHVVESLAHAQNLWMMLAGAATLMMVWGYNAVLDSRDEY